jgi:pimeloyl-ACP methyl ester carboxylesterase
MDLGLWQRLGVWLDTQAAWRTRGEQHREARAPGYGYLELPGCALRYRDHGEGDDCYVFAADPPIVLEHYDELVRVLSKRARMIVFELPGFGFSPARSGFDFALDSSVVYAAMALDRLGLRGVTLCFPCASAYIALALARARPELVSRLLLAQAPAYAGELAWKRRRDPRGVLGRPVWGQLAMQALSKRSLPAWFSLSVGDRSRLQPFTELAAQRLSEGARWSLASAFQRYLVEDGAPAQAEQPVIALWGERDRSHQGTDRESSRSLGRRVEVVRWEDIGHFPELEAPERFTELLRAGPWPG